MGSCVSSIQKRTSDSNVKLDMPSFGSKNHNLVIPPSPIKEKPANGYRPINDWSTTSHRDGGSKEETFFDSRGWLDSDCEDDFFSVNGDFTPSRGNTPVHPALTTRTPQVNKTLLEDRTPGSIPEPSPTGRKMKLGELFKQSSRESPEDQHVDEQYSSSSQKMANGNMEFKPTIVALPPKSTNDTPYTSVVNSATSSERTANGDLIMEKKPMRSVQCCLPSLISCGNHSERKKKMSPAVAVNG